MRREVVQNLTVEMKIINAVFMNQSIVVFTHEKEAMSNEQGFMCSSHRELSPEHLADAVKLLFGAGATIVQDYSNNCKCLRIIGASYILENVETVNPEWYCREKSS